MMNSMNRPDPHKPLRQNIRMLGNILGDVITALEGEAVLELVARIRDVSQQFRGGDKSARDSLIDLIGKLDDRHLMLMAKAFGHFLNLANIAEQHHRVRRRREYRRHNDQRPQKGSLEELFPRLLASGVDKQRIIERLLETKIDFVLTAHPTEIQRRTMIQKYSQIEQLLGELDREDLTVEERRWSEDELHQVLLSAWRTDELRFAKPTPVEEAHWGFAVVEQTLWDVVPVYLRHLDMVLQETVGRSLPIDFSPIRFSSWMGGDRDGNPNVTAEVTREVLLLGQWECAELLKRDLIKLRSALSMASCSSELREKVGNAREPYRVLLREFIDNLSDDMRQIEAVLENKQRSYKPCYSSLAELKAPLLLCYRSLSETGMKQIADGLLADILRKLACFGRSLLKLDIRQDARRHTRLLTSLTDALGLPPYDRMSEDERREFLVEQLTGCTLEIPASFAADDEDSEVLSTLRLIAEQDMTLLGAYVISMAKTPSDVLAVYLLQKLAGVRSLMRVVPLFETLADLSSAGDSIDALLRIDWLRERTTEMEVMIGYSDSAKDAGFLAASWAQFKAQEALTEVCSRHGVKLVLFHGRGGSISRGGASAHQALLSQPPGAVHGGFRVTEQGEVIRFKFGLPGVALRTLEVYMSAMLEADLLCPESPLEEWRAMMDQMAEKSASLYRSVVQQDERFLDYFMQTTPIRELEEIAIGSRPARRSGGAVVGSLRAIPWVFAWTQVRLMLPAWLGTQAIFESGETVKARLREMLNNWVFFRNIIGMQEMVLAKSLPDITEHYERVLTDPALHQFGQQLRDELAKVSAGWLELTGEPTLLTDSPVIQRSIDVRNPYTDVLNLLQVEALKRYRAHREASPSEVRTALLLTIVGVAAGMRNTG